MNKITHCKLSENTQKRLLEFFVLEVTARSAADMLKIEHNSSALFYKKIRQVITHHLQNERDEMFEGCIELNESYFGGFRKGKRGRSDADKVIVFEKMRPFTYQEIRSFIEKFVAIYPDWEDIYLTPLTTAYMTADIHLGDGPNSVFSYYENYSGDYIIHSHPGESKPVQVNWEFGNMQELIVAVPDNSCGITDGVLIRLTNEKGVQKDIEITVMSEVSIDVTEFAHTKGSLIIDNNGSDACDSVFISAR